MPAPTTKMSRFTGRSYILRPLPVPMSRAEECQMAIATESILDQQLLDRCRERAAGYDRDNRFFQEDFDELKAAGYLRMAIPREFGGLGMNLAQVGRETRTLAQYAPATALALNMHHYWVGDAADVWRSGDKSLKWILDEAAAGEVFA